MTPIDKSSFKEYCLRSLGKPVIEINVDDDQVDDRVDEALSYFLTQCLQNKYSLWYFNIIQKALDRNWTRDTAGVYTELHHIVPKALGGKDDRVVFLTAREHFVCHMLLTKMLSGEHKAKMVWAIMCLKGKSNRYVNSYLYENAKKHLSHTESAKIRMSKTRIENGTFREENNPMYGRKGILSPSYGKRQTEDHKNKRIVAIIGRKHTEEARSNMRLNRPKGPSGKKWFNNGVIETFGLPENKPAEYVFGRLRRA